jgi:hypothetical protein
MAQLIIDIPDNKVDDVVDSICFAYNYQDQIEQFDASGNSTGFIPNPETKIQFAKKQIIQLIKIEVIRAKKSQLTSDLNTNLDTLRDNILNYDIT